MCLGTTQEARPHWPGVQTSLGSALWGGWGPGPTWSGLWTRPLLSPTDELAGPLHLDQQAGGQNGPLHLSAVSKLWPPPPALCPSPSLFPSSGSKRLEGDPNGFFAQLICVLCVRACNKFPRAAITKYHKLGSFKCQLKIGTCHLPPQEWGHSFLATAVADLQHIPEGLQGRGQEWVSPKEIYSLTVLEAKTPKSRCQRGHAPSEGSRGGFFLPLPASGGSKCSSVFGWIAPASISVFTRPLLSLCLSSSVSYKDTCHWI